MILFQSHCKENVSEQLIKVFDNLKKVLVDKLPNKGWSDASSDVQNNERMVHYEKHLVCCSQRNSLN
jgi:hypothetical protein